MRRWILGTMFVGILLGLSGCAVEDLLGGQNSDERHLNSINSGNRRSFPPGD